MSWPRVVINAFDSISTTHQSDWYIPYGAVLGTLFPLSEDYIVGPQYEADNKSDATDPAVVYVVEKNNHPVFILRVQNAHHLSKDSRRGKADHQMRARFNDLRNENRIRLPVLYGVSAIGPYLAKYEYNVAANNVSPEPVEAPPNNRGRLFDRAPCEWWSEDVLQEGGSAMLKELAEATKARVAQADSNDIL